MKKIIFILLLAITITLGKSTPPPEGCTYVDTCDDWICYSQTRSYYLDGQYVGAVSKMWYQDWPQGICD